MTKTILYWIIAILVVIIFGLCVWFNCAYGTDSSSKTANLEVVDSVSNTCVEDLIRTDASYFDNMAGDILFYESQIVLDKPFNEGDKFVAIEVTNVFQQNLKGDKPTTNVYEFKHVINSTDVDIQIHEGMFWLEDKPIDLDSLSLTFDGAYTKAKESNLVPSKSRFMVLRKPLGPVVSNPCYIIGNDNYGMMFVDGITGEVSDKSPWMPKK